MFLHRFNEYENDAKNEENNRYRSVKMSKS